jgi:hypothetical protein
VIPVACVLFSPGGVVLDWSLGVKPRQGLGCVLCCGDVIMAATLSQLLWARG